MTQRCKALAIGLCLLLATLFLQSACLACTVFCLEADGGLVVGRSYDWGFGEGMVVVNKRNQTKTALVYWGESRKNLARWTSKYGSVTFVQYGREIAFAGMNEAGLVVHELWLAESAYPPADDRPSLSVDQYVQYILDNFSSVDEIAAQSESIRLRPTTNDFTKIHFFAVDATGASIVLEFIQGKMICHAKEDMPVKALANNTYESSLAYHEQLGGAVPGGNSSLDRFARAAVMSGRRDPAGANNMVPYAFKILDAVRQGTYTKFQMVFDIKNRIIYFKSTAHPELRFFRLDACDFSCRTPSKILDMNAPLSGDVTDRFVNYTTRINEALIIKAWRDLGYKDIYRPALRMISRYPMTFKCAR